MEFSSLCPFQFWKCTFSIFHWLFSCALARGVVVVVFETNEERKLRNKINLNFTRRRRQRGASENDDEKIIKSFPSLSPSSPPRATWIVSICSQFTLFHCLVALVGWFISDREWRKHRRKTQSESSPASKQTTISLYHQHWVTRSIVCWCWINKSENQIRRFVCGGEERESGNLK